MKCCEYGHWGRIQSSYISLKLLNGPIKLECLIPDSLFLPSLMFVGKAGSGTPGLPFQASLMFAGKAWSTLVRGTLLR
jgi:hypothetical protein